MTEIKALATVAWYNGWSEKLCEIRDYIKSEIEKPHEDRFWIIVFPKFLDDINPDLYPRVIWAMMVEMFGNYGSSPRFGWIERNKSRKALKWIDNLCKLSCLDLEDENE